MAYLDWFHWKPGNLGNHFGDSVCLHCIHYMERRGQKNCTLTTQPWRVPAVKLYHNLGFDIIAAQKTYGLPL